MKYITDPFENIYLNFCKSILGVTLETSNLAVCIQSLAIPLYSLIK